VFDYRSTTYIPSLVQRAENLAEQMNYSNSTSREVGRLLQLLTSQFLSGVLGEIGTGCGVASAWMVSALAPGASFFTVEADAARAAAARALFEAYPNVHVVQGDWRELVRFGQFSLLFAGFESPRLIEPERLLQTLRPGGMIVLDRINPGEQLPLDLRKKPDQLRKFFLNDARLLATEVLVSPGEAVILATRVE
jgi:predicted O-methyltransferase YrrM